MTEIRKIVICLLFFLFFNLPSPVFAIEDIILPSADYVPGQIIVKFKKGESPQELGQTVAAQNARGQSLFGLVLNGLGDFATHLKGEKTTAEKSGEIAEVESAVNVQNTQSLLLQGYALVSASAEEPIARMLGAYRGLPEVESANPNYLAYALDIPNDSLFSQQWGLKNIKAPQAWDVTHGSPSIKIAILDTGISKNHPDLSSKVDQWVNFSSSDSEDDLYGHGTHVAGIAAAATDNGQGVAGTGFNTHLLSVKVLGDDGSGSYASIIKGITWAADNGASVINLSLGGFYDIQELEDAVNDAWEKGVVVVAAAGNCGQGGDDCPAVNPIMYPAGFEKVIAVAATDQNDQKTSFSEYGSWVDVTAPGIDIWSTLPFGLQVDDSSTCNDTDSDGYDDCSGTSMASPFVAGLAGLLFGAKPSLTNTQVRTFLEEYADKIFGTGTYWINGRINAENSILAAQGGPTPTPTPTSETPPPTPTLTLTPSPTPPGGVTPTSSPTLSPTPTESTTPTITPTSQPTLTPSPTPMPLGCPDDCSQNSPSKSQGNADCNQIVDGEDYNIWQLQFAVYAQGGQIPKEQRTADFNCQEDESKTQVVDLLDFEFFRRNAFGQPPTPTSGAFPTPTPSLETTPTPSPTPSPTSVTPTPTPTSGQRQPLEVGEEINKKVFVIIFDPLLSEKYGSQKLTQYKNWNNPYTLTNQVVEWFKNTTGNRMTYTIVNTLEINEFVKKIDGFIWNEDSYLEAVRNNNPHNPDTADYSLIFETNEVCNRLNNDEIDELWLWGGPWFGFYESRLAGPGAFNYNSPPLTGTSCNKLIPIMGYSYEVGFPNAIHNFGHRTEATMTRVYGSWQENRIAHNWDRFGLVKAQSPDFDFSGCGSTHYTPNSPGGYIYDSRDVVNTICDDFDYYPNLLPIGTVEKTPVNCDAWNCSDIGYYEYWFRHLPKFEGRGPDGKLNDWWQYLMDPNKVLE